MMDAQKIADDIINQSLHAGVPRLDRVKHLCNAVDGQPAEVFWTVFHALWSGCEGTHQADVHGWITRLLRTHRSYPAYGYMDAGQRAFFDALPDMITIYRGCDIQLVRRVSWSTDIGVAEFFARRGRCTSRDVIATAFMPKEAVFTVSIDRKESEVIIDPRRLRGLSVSSCSQKEAA